MGSLTGQVRDDCGLKILISVGIVWPRKEEPAAWGWTREAKSTPICPFLTPVALMGEDTC